MKGSFPGLLNNCSFFGHEGKVTSRGIKKYWGWLISPSVALHRPDELRQSRLLATLLVTLIVISVSIESLTIHYAAYQGYSGHWLVFGLIFVFGLAFLLNRRGHFNTAAWITVVTQSIAIFWLTFYTEGWPIDVDFLNFLFVPLLFTTVLLSNKTILLLAGLYVAGMAFSGFIPGIDGVQVVLGPGSFVAAAACILYMIIRHRNALELDRQRELAEKEEQYRALLETGYAGICIVAVEKILDANPQFAQMFGYELPELIGKSVEELVPAELRAEIASGMEEIDGQVSEILVRRRDGSPFHVEAISRSGRYHGQPVQIVAIRDITERIQTEEALDQNERLYRSLFEGANDAIFWLSFADVHIAANQKAADMLGYSVEELIGKPISEVVVRHEYPDAMKKKDNLLAGKIILPYERIIRKKDGTEFPVEVNISLIRDKDGNPLFIQSIVRDITERKQTEARMRHQLEQLNALREIDRMITGSLDLRMTLNIILSQATTQLNIDAADILLLKQHLGHLEYSAQLGFSPGAMYSGPIRLKEPLAGRAVLERRLVIIQDLTAILEECPRIKSLIKLGYKSGLAVPLIAKGMVKGVLEVFQRGPLTPSAEWIDFLEMLGGQAAITVESNELFQSLQRSNMNLVQAYDATLEGWAKALELRDEETEGHSQRVTDMTVRLGQVMGFRDSDIIHLRRGALLHDIGKMAIPDSILLKPGPLTQAERETMKQHPIYAKKMLSTISFLGSAVDIPYCHHEKWDGTGYPRGLKGEEIPLAARIFAIIDVWDALTSDRPYRTAWPDEKALAYICEQSGKHFDPQVVEQFVVLLEQERQFARERERAYSMPLV